MPPAIPTATYRVQLTPQFGFDHAAAIVPYLRALGISHIYASPFLKARAGSTHGYDIVDHTAFNPELGGEPAFLRMSDALAQADMGLILDFVPNHMAVHAADNPWWLDVLEWGPRSRYAKFFDIEWDTPTGRPRVLLPILGQSYGDVLEKGEIELRYDAAEGSFSAWYFEHRLPIGPNRYGEILQKVVATADARDSDGGRKLLALATRYRGPRNPGRDETPDFKRELAAVARGTDIIERGLAAYQPKSGHSGAVPALHYLLERQHYRPAYWRLAGSDINYRRFFDINSLAGLRVEEPEVFRTIHGLVFRLVKENRLQGLRLDHIDGLRDPHQYLRRLQRELQAISRKRPCYVIVEKIFAEGEPVPRFPGVAGTTGYGSLNTISRTLLDSQGLEKIEQTWCEVAGAIEDFSATVRKSKQRVLQTILSSEFNVLSQLLARIAAGHYSTRDFTAARLREALELFVLNFPVYRTYVGSVGRSPVDRSIIQATIDQARAEWFGADVKIFDFLADALTMDLIAPDRAVRHSTTRVRRFASKIQQFTGPLMAKSLEDTAFYRYHRLLALNEVGGDPAATGISPAQFHDSMANRAEFAPNGLTATGTHDTKRGEDARARLLSLTELADEWAEAARHWRGLNASLIADLPPPRPTAAHEYMLYQALLGAWPLEGFNESFIERMQAYAVKAAREGKELTSWIAPNEIYEAGLRSLVTALLDPRRSEQFMQSFDALARRAALLGALRSLAQVTLKLTVPGIPDIYQGTEFWDLSLVDPDNRRPVDFNARQVAWQSLALSPDWAQLAGAWQDGGIKFALLYRLLELRSRHPALFRHGAYRPLDIRGPDQDELIAFARTHDHEAIVVVLGRRFGRVSDKGRSWPQPECWQAFVDVSAFTSMRNVIDADAIKDGNGLSVGPLLGPLPVAVLQATVTVPKRTKFG